MRARESSKATTPDQRITVGPLPRTAARRRDDLISIGSALALAAVSVFPVFLSGALGVQVTAAFDIDAGGLGLVVSSYFAASAVTVARIGRVVERVGARVGAAWGGGLAAASLVGASLAPSRSVLVAAMMAGGIGNAVVGPTASLLLARVSEHRRGLGFGAKQAAIMMASMFGGVALPVIGLLLGWRWVYACGAIVAGVVAIAGWRVVEHRPAPVVERPRVSVSASHGPLLPLAAGFGLGTAAATALGVLVVSSLVDQGVEEGTAGVLLALGSLSTILSRLVSGWYVDRNPDVAVRLIVAMLVAGAVGFAMMGSGVPSLMLLGALLAFTAGWGWTGLIVQVIATRAGRGAAAATGVGQTGAAIGGIVGPSVLGAVAASSSFAAAWFVACGLLLGAGACVRLAAGRVVSTVPSDTGRYG